MNRWLMTSIALTLAAAGGCAYVSLVHPDILRERIPTHWDLQMQADAWTEREHYYRYLLLGPAVMTVMVLLQWLLPLISPRQFKVDSFAATFGYCFTVVIGFFGYLSGLLVWVGIAESDWWGRCFVAGFFVLFGLLGNVLGKVQRNFWLGVRTPWTLASDVVWDRTHRLTAWLWVGASIIGSVLVVAGAPYWAALALLLIAALWPALYSLLLYKRLERHGRV